MTFMQTFIFFIPLMIHIMLIPIHHKDDFFRKASLPLIYLTILIALATHYSDLIFYNGKEYLCHRFRYELYYIFHLGIIWVHSMCFMGGSIVSKAFKLPDPAKHGSGNIGTSNIGRVSGKLYGILAFLIDSLKMPLLLYYSQYTIQIVVKSTSMISTVISVSQFIILGHISGGGKGMASYIGLLGTLNIYHYLIVIAFWLFFSLFLPASFATITSIFISWFLYADAMPAVSLYFRALFMLIQIGFIIIIVHIYPMIKKYYAKKK